MDLTTDYLGLSLPHPLMPGASPLAENLDAVRRLEDAGAAAIVLPSLFEEQILNEEFRASQDVDAAEETFPEALTYYPRRDEFRVVGPERYLETVRRTKEAVRVPVIASLNGSTTGGWVDYATRIQDAGADALELNVYLLATDPLDTSVLMENRVVAITQAVKQRVGIPVAVKLSPFYSSLPNLLRRLEEEAEADGVVLFNRFYQPDIDVESLEVTPTLRLSDSSELLLRLRWLALLSGRVKLSLGATGGIHDAVDAVKAVMAGAHTVQLVSALLANGPQHLGKVLSEMSSWMERHEYASLEQMRGSMSLRHCPDPTAFERGNYVRILQGGTKYV